MFCLLTFFIVIFHISCETDENQIKVFVNNISPYSNPIETYRYYMLPFCSPKNLFSGQNTLGETLSGDRKMSSIYEFSPSSINIKNITKEQVCQKTYNQNELQQFRDVISQNYTAEFYIFDFRMHDILGVQKDERYYLKNHIEFNLYVSSDFKQVYHINVSQSQQQDFVDISNIDDSQMIPFYFTSKLIPLQNKETITYGDIIETEGDKVINWTTLIFKFIFVVVLSIIVGFLIRRTVRKDFIQVKTDEEMDMSFEEDIGWKLIRVESFDLPSSKSLLTAMIGSGVQFIIVILLEMTFGSLGLYYYGHKGTIKTTGLICYAFTGFFNGYYASKYYKFLGGKEWAINISLSCVLFPASMITTWLTINSIAWYYDSTATIPFSSIIFIGFLWAVIYLPLTIIGGVSGRLRTVDQMPNADIKYRAKKLIPQPPKYIKNYHQNLRIHRPESHFIGCGILTFLSIHTEIKYILQSAWGHYNFHEYSMILIGFILIILVVATLSMVLTYLELNTQDYRWWWRSFFNGGSIGFFFFLYSIYYYIFESQMNGLIQFAFFFGYSFFASAMMFVMLGTVSFIASMRFVFFIYGQSKGD